MNPSPLLRHISFGPVLGIHSAGADAWLGVPYAAPPIGPLRWRAPAAPMPWIAVRPANRFGHPCLQIGGLQGPGKHEEPFGPSLADGFGSPVGDEDCLTLNIWRPASEATDLPIVVFVHGGANLAGYTGDPLYDGAHLARRLRAVVVTINYRLGVFGWFNHPALEADAEDLSASGNFGLLDIIKALEFVRDNGAAFGGNPDDVTLMGQSAGAVNGFALMVSPLARGLFHRVVALSGALVSVPKTVQHEYAATVVRELRASDDSGHAGRLNNLLRATPGAELVEAAARAGTGGLPTADGTVLPVDPAAAVAAGRHLRMPLLIGTTAEEGKFFVKDVYRVSDAERFRIMLRTDPDGTDQPAMTDLLLPPFASAEGFGAAARAAGKVVDHLIATTRELFAGRMPVFAMEVAWARQREPWRTLIGSAHGIDLPFWFGNFGPSSYSPSFGSINQPGRAALAEAMVASLESFIRTGNPASAAIPAKWEPWSPDGVVMRFDADDRGLRIHAVLR